MGDHLKGIAHALQSVPALSAIIHVPRAIKRVVAKDGADPTLRNLVVEAVMQTCSEAMILPGSCNSMALSDNGLTLSLDR